MGFSIIWFKGSQVDFPNKCVLKSLNVSNSADHDEMQETNQLPILGVSSIQRVYSPLSDEFNQAMPLGPKTYNILV